MHSRYFMITKSIFKLISHQFVAVATKSFDKSGAILTHTSTVQIFIATWFKLNTKIIEEGYIT